MSSKSKKRKRKDHRREFQMLKEQGQFDKLEQDSRFYAIAADEAHKQRMQYDSGSLEYISASGPFFTHLGYALDLKLKSLISRTKGNWNRRGDHKLKPLFDQLDPKIRNGLNKVFEENPVGFEFQISRIPSTEEIKNGQSIKDKQLSRDFEKRFLSELPYYKKCNLEELLDLCDRIGIEGKPGLHHQAYSFENFIEGQHWVDLRIFVNIEYLIDIIGEYSKTLDNPNFKKDKT